MRNLLLLSYYFPPLGMSGVQRVLKLCKYLPENGWRPIVITPRHRGSYGYDAGLLREAGQTLTIRTASLDPLFCSPARRDAGAAARRTAAPLINQWFVPDNKIGWVPFAVHAGMAAAKKNRIDAILSSAPPFSSHLAAVVLKRLLRLPLCCDFRDAWTGNPMARYATLLHRRLDSELEGLVIRNADRVFSINREISATLSRHHGGATQDKLRIMNQGFDPGDFRGPAAACSGKFRIAYTGTFIEGRSPRPLIAALRLMITEHPGLAERLEIVIAGTLRAADRALIEGSGLSSLFIIRGYLPHDQSVRVLQDADLLWLMIAEREGPTVATGKLYEYLGAGKPIVASVPPAGAAAGVISQTRAGVVVSPDDPQALAAAFSSYYAKWQSGEPLMAGPARELRIYDRRAIAKAFADELDQLCGRT